MKKYSKLSTALTALAFCGTVGMAQAQEAASEAPTSLSETYQNWIVRCATRAVAEDQDPVRVCQMTQELRQQDSNKRVLAVTLQRAETGGNLTVVVPFGLLLSEGLTIEVADATLLSAGFRTCLPAGCIVAAELTPEQITSLAAGDEATVGMTTTNDQPLKVKLSLAGFDAAWNRLRDLREG